jgi:hypothetical protein
MRKIKLMPDYNCWPLWEAGDEVGNIDPATLPISEKLQQKLLAWSRAYTETLDQDYPPDSKFTSLDNEEAFEKEGLSLRNLLANELGQEYEILYFSQQKNRIIDLDEIKDDV